jgi:Fe2+ or Zn2+ uptake regulation protein
MGKDPSRGDFRAYSGMSLATIRTVLNKFKGFGLVDIKYRKNRGGTGFKTNEHTLKAW